MHAVMWAAFAATGCTTCRSIPDRLRGRHHRRQQQQAIVGSAALRETATAWPGYLPRRAAGRLLMLAGGGLVDWLTRNMRCRSTGAPRSRTNARVTCCSTRRELADRRNQTQVPRISPDAAPGVMPALLVSGWTPTRYYLSPHDVPPLRSVDDERTAARHHRRDGEVRRRGRPTPSSALGDPRAIRPGHVRPGY